MLYVFIAKASAVLADCEPHSMAAGSIVCAGVFGVKGLDGISTFYADWHRIYDLGSSVPGCCIACNHIVMFRLRVWQLEWKTRFRDFAPRSARGLRTHGFPPRFFWRVSLSIISVELPRNLSCSCSQSRLCIKRISSGVCVKFSQLRIRMKKILFDTSK